MKTPILLRVGLAVLCGAALSPGAHAATTPSPFLDQVTTHFAAWDTNNDKSLSMTEVDSAFGNPAIKGPEAAAIASLRRGMNSKHLASLTQADITASVPFSANAKPTPPNYDSMYRAALKKIRSAKHDLFLPGGPQLDTLSQGRLGDCFLLASLGTYVNHDPNGLQKMMQPQPDGKIAVTFGSGQHLTLDPPTDAEIALGSATRSQGEWSNMFEKAVGTVLLSQQKTQRQSTPYGIINVGGAPLTVLQFITGHKVVRLYCQEFRNKEMPAAERETKLAALRSQLIKTQEAGRMIVAGNESFSNQVRVPHIVFSHSYGVMGYDAKADAVTFWNPFGNEFTPKGEPGLENGYVTKHGRFTVPLTQAVQWLGAFSVETDQPING